MQRVSGGELGDIANAGRRGRTGEHEGRSGAHEAEEGRRGRADILRDRKHNVHGASKTAVEGAVATYTQAASAEDRQIGYRKRAGAGGAQPACNYASSSAQKLACRFV